MFLLSKTVVNHVKSNLFSTSVITFFAGCSAFVQISTDNIKEIIDASIKPYTKASKNDMFIKTGKSDIYSGGSSFTIPLSVEVKDDTDKTDAEKSQPPSSQTKLRYATPQGWFNDYSNKVTKDRIKKVGKETADYGKDYCLPRKGIQSIYTNYWFRPKIRFKGPWDAEIQGSKILIPKDNLTFRVECADYVEQMPITNNEFIGEMMFDYLMGWANDNTVKHLGLVTFIGSDDKKFQTGYDKNTNTPVVNDGVRSPENATQVISNEKEEWKDTTTKYVWESPITWSKHTGNGKVSEKAEVGKFFGLSKGGEGFTKLEGKEASRLSSTEYMNKYRERKKAKLKVTIEEWLLNSQYLDVRKILQEFRDSQSQRQTQLVQTDNQSALAIQSSSTDYGKLWEPVHKNPWITKALTSRKILKNSNLDKIKAIFNKYRLYQDNQLLRFKKDPQEDSKLKFNIHQSVQISNSGVSSSSILDNSKVGHTFKVISIEDEKERGEVNPLVIVKGNPLFDAREDQEQLLNDFIAAYDLPFYSPWMVPMLRMISRAKFSGDVTDIRETFHWWVDYLQYPWRDTWNIPAVKAKEFEPELYERLQLWLSEIQERTWSRAGSRIIFNFTADQRFYPLSKRLAPHLNIQIKDFKLVGYIEQPTSFFTVISPEYANINGFEPIPDEKYREFRKIVNNLWLNQEDWESKYNAFVNDSENAKHIVNIGDRKMIIVGLGITPDLMYPMQSWLTFQPDKYKEGLVFVDKFGFNDLKDRGTIKFQEQYITIGLPEKVKSQSRSEQLAYMKKLKDYIDDKLKDRKDYYLLTKLGEDEGSDQIYSIRNSYVPTFQSRIGAISYTLSSVVYAVVLLLLIILIKKYLQSNMYLFGNFIANGIMKADVLVNICLFTFIPLAVATAIGYLLSLVMQSTFYSIVSSYWFLNVRMISLGASSAFYFILKVLAFVLPISYFCSLWTLKDNVSILLKTTSSMKVNYLTLLFYRLMYRISAMWKFRSVLIFNTLNQSGILSMTSVIGFIFLTFFTHNHGKFAEVGKAEQVSKAHEFEFDLETPTKESGEFNLSTYSDLGKYFVEKIDNTTAQTKQLPAGVFAVTPSAPTEHYFVGQKRENVLLADILEKYTGNFDGWWKDGVAGSCDPIAGKPKNSSGGYEEGSWVCLGGLGVLKQKNDEKKWEIYTPSTLKTPQTTTAAEETYKHFYDKTPIFDYWSTRGEFKDMVKSNKSKTNLNNLGKIYEVNNKKYFLPSLKTLLELYKNYWIISSRDYEIIERAIDFFKGKTVLRILLDLNIEYVSDVGRFNYNVWDWTSKNLEKVHPILQKLDEQNYDQFIQEIIKSKYGPFFVSKFMTQHADSKDKTYQQLSQLITRQGETYQGKKTFIVKGEDVGREQESWNFRVDGAGQLVYPTTTLKENSTSSLENTTSPKNDFKDGLYYLDGSKIIIFNQSTEISKDIILMYHPEFLYLIFTVISDFSSQPSKYTLPLKYTFGNVVHSADSNNQAGAPEHYFSTIDGKFKYQSVTSRNQSRSKRAAISQNFDPIKTPDGDQTYTWTKGDLKRNNQIISSGIKIIGLKEDKRGAFYKLYSGNNLVNSKLYNSTNSVGNGTEIYPIIVNKFAAKLHGLKIGDTLHFRPDNHTTRFTCKLLKNSDLTSSQADCEYKNSQWENKKIRDNQLKVVDIFDSYYKESFFMSQRDVNKIIGLNEYTGFNGIFTPKRGGKLPEQISSALSSYSVSGIYTNVQQKLGSGAFRNLMKHIPPFQTANSQADNFVKVKRNYSVYSGASNTVNYDIYVKATQTDSQTISAAEDEKAEDETRNFIANQFAKAFRDYIDPMGTAIQGIANHSIAGDVVFKNLGNLTDNVSYLFIFIIFPLLLISLITIVYLLIKDLENVFVTMKLLGFGNKENSMPVIVYLLALLFVSSFIGSCVVPYLLNKYVNTLFVNQMILLPLTLSYGLMTGVFSLLAGIYVFSIIRSYFKIKGIYLPVSIKLLVG